MKRILSQLAAMLSIVAVLTGCTNPSRSNVRASDVQAEYQTGEKLIAQMEANDDIHVDPALKQYVQTIVARVSRVRPQNAPPLRTVLVSDADINAFTTGGGHVFVNVGLLAAMEDEAQVAMVLAHEIAHVDMGHVLQGKENSAIVGLVGLAAILGATAAGVDAEVAVPAVAIGAAGYQASFTRTQETQADQLGFRYLLAGGYDAAEGAKSFAVLERVYGSGSTPPIFRSHPLSSDRLAALTRMAQQAGNQGGRIAKQEYLRKTDKVRKEVLTFLQSEGRTAEANQLERNIRATR